MYSCMKMLIYQNQITKLFFLQFNNLSCRLNASDPTTTTTTAATAASTTTYFPTYNAFVISSVTYASCLFLPSCSSLRPSGHMLEVTGVILYCFDF